MDGHEISDGVVALRRWSTDDAPWYAETVSADPLIQQFTAELPTVTAEDVRSAIRGLLAKPTDAAGFLIADADSHQRLGNIALTYEEAVGDVSYWLADYARGRGIATRALRLFTHWAHTVLDLSELRLWAQVNNTGSRAVAERAGYLRDPERDKVREVKDESWSTVSYVHRWTAPTVT
ncbi:GNAT family N-acetyltransferase [Paractinoplanes hotanensis]|uniref:GNAT family N-acetyltransferase n=1 Tax=Paractinoplanes hotanensis TaxID=2906497 RepID=A0ABT0YEK1_9ACTN|nr:GNAT family N-acetyltransferase [Actinoplanes hotanensis]MCM4084486.1 GNAT family N-acetyltransferase [Actinoplanes hotanensis]